MRANTLWFALIMVTSLIEATWLGVVRIQGVMPDLILLFVVYIAVNFGEERAMFSGLIGGILQDVAGESSLGHHVLCLVLTGYVVGLVSQRLITGHPAVKSGLVLIAALLNGLLYTTVARVIAPDTSALYVFGVSVVPKAFYTALVTPIAFIALDRALSPLRQPLQGGAS